MYAFYLCVSIAILLVTGGRLGDLYGRKRMFLLGVGGFILFSALCGLAPDALFLIIFRITQGAAAALMTPQVISFIQVCFVDRERAIAMSAYGATLGFASILGLVLGGWLLAVNIGGIGWRSLFLINLPLGVLVLITSGLTVSESKEPGARSLDYGGVVLLTLALFLFIFSLVLGGNTGWPLWTKICLVLSLPCLIAFWSYERRLTARGETPLISPALFRSRSFTVGNLINILNGILWNGMLFLFSLYLQTILYLTPLQAGLVMTVGSIAFMIMSVASSSLLLRSPVYSPFFSYSFLYHAHSEQKFDGSRVWQEYVDPFTCVRSLSGCQDARFHASQWKGNESPSPG